MATIAEKFDSPQVGNLSAKKSYVIEGTDDELEAKGLLIATSPGFYEGLTRQNFEVHYLGDAAWEGVASYSKNPPVVPPATGQNTFSFDTSVGSLGVMSQKPVAVYVEKVYDAGDFTGLAIGN